MPGEEGGAIVGGIVWGRHEGGAVLGDTGIVDAIGLEGFDGGDDGGSLSRREAGLVLPYPHVPSCYCTASRESMIRFARSTSEASGAYAKPAAM
jgi:hypothetical protein